MAEVFSIKEILLRPAKNGLSDAFWVGGGMVVAIITPPKWTPALLTFQHCALEGQEWNDIYNPDGSILNVVPVENTELRVIPSLNRVGYLRLRSGTPDTPVRQEAARKFKIVIQPL